VQRIEERNMFYLAPFFLIALLVWIERGAQRPRWAIAAAALAAALPATIPYTRFIGVTATADTLALLPWWKLQEHVISLGHVRLVISLCAAALAALFLALPRRAALVLPLLVLAYLGVVQRPVESRTTFASRGSLYQGIRDVPRDWIDRAVGPHADVALLWTGRADVHMVWENEVFNRSVGRVYDTEDPLPGGLASTPVTIGRDGYLRTDGHLLHERYAVVDGSLDLNGTPIALDTAIGVNLWRLSGPIRSVTQVTGLYKNDTWSKARVVYERLACRGGSVRVSLLGDASLFSGPQTVTANGVPHRVTPGEPTTLTVPLQGCRAVFAISPTRVPGGADTRRLGIHFVAFSYLPAR